MEEAAPLRRRVWRMVRGLTLAIICLVMLAALGLIEENWRGKRAWEKLRNEREATGDSFEIKAFIPPPVPDAQNFAATPLLRPIFPDNREYASQLQKKFELPLVDGKQPFLASRSLGKKVDIESIRKAFGGQDIPAALKRYGAEMREMEGAAQRPYSRFPLDYEKGFELDLPHLPVILSLQRPFAVRALAELSEQQTDTAFSDAKTLFNVADAVKAEPELVSVLVRLTMSQVALQVVWEGLRDHEWSDVQLRELQERLSGEDFLGHLSLGLRVSRACFETNTFRYIINSKQAGAVLCIWRLVEIGWGYQNMITASQWSDEMLHSVDLSSRTVSFDRLRQLQCSMFDRGTLCMKVPYKALAILWAPVSIGVIGKTAYCQTSCNEALIACALERCRLARGKFPVALEELVPDYLPKLPMDVATSLPLHYRLTSEGKYILYSVGSDGEDGGGKTVLKPSGSIDITHGDWVWEP